MLSKFIVYCCLILYIYSPKLKLIEERRYHVTGIIQCDRKIEADLTILYNKAAEKKRKLYKKEESSRRYIVDSTYCG